MELRAQAIDKAVKTALSAMLPEQVKYRVLHHASRSSFGLQVADYCNWAIYRKWEREDERSYELIRTRVRSEFDIFRQNLASLPSSGPGHGINDLVFHGKPLKANFP